jgi:CheY-like chemotaxis protein
MTSGAERSTTDDVATAGTPRRPIVLCIDDDPAICRAIGVQLSAHGIEVLEASSGMQGYRAAIEHNPDVILTDMIMPDGEGNYICGRLRTHPLTRQTPIIVVSGQANPGVKRQMLSLGANAYLAKPIDWTELLRALGRYIDLPANVG